MFANSKFGSPEDLFDLDIPIKGQQTPPPSSNSGQIKESVQPPNPGKGSEKEKIPEENLMEDIPDPESKKEETGKQDDTSEKTGEEQEQVEKEQDKEKDQVQLTESVVLTGIAEDLKELDGIELQESDLNDLPSFYNALKSKIIDEKLSSEGDVMVKLKQEIMEDLGIDEQTANMVQGKYFGVDDKAYKEALFLKKFVDFEFSKETTQDTRKLFEIYYQQNNVPTSDIERMVNVDMKSEDIDDLIESRQKHIESQANLVVKETEDTVLDRQQKHEAFNKKRRTEVDKLLRSGEIKGRKYSFDKIQEFRKAVTQKTEEVTLPDGRKQKVTPFQKKRFEQSVEEELATHMAFYFGEDVKAEEKKDEKNKHKKRGSFIQRLNKDLKPLPDFQATEQTTKKKEVDEFDLEIPL